MRFFGSKKRQSEIEATGPAETTSSYVMTTETTKESVMKADENDANDASQDEVAPERSASQHLCFNRFCDMRVGTFSVNMLNILVRIVAIVFSFSWGGLHVFPTDLVSIVLSTIAICGAINYEYTATGLAAFGFSLITIVHIFSRASIFGILFDALLIYPTGVLTFELFKGSMGQSTYVEYIEPEIRQVSRDIHASVNKMQQQHFSDSQDGAADIEGGSDGETDYVNIETADAEKTSGSLA
jgi:hypothetical protein